MKKKRVKKSKSLVLEEHIVNLIERYQKSKKEIKQSIDSVVKKENKKVKVKAKKKVKVKTKDVYGKSGKRDEYRSLQGTGVYDQIRFSPFAGFFYRSNIKNNDEFYKHLETSEIKAHRDELGEHNLVSSQGMQEYAKKTTMNALLGEAMMGIGGMNHISVEEKELMNFQMYDITQKQLYLAEIGFLGFNGNRVMHAQLD